MTWLRSVWMQRSIVSMLLASMAPVVMASAVQASQQRAVWTHADWLRGQLAGEATPAVEEALAAAVEEAGSQSLEAFLLAFIDAYAAAPDAQPLTELFAHAAATDEAVIAQLQQRYLRIVGEALLLRPMAWASPASSSLDRTPPLKVSAVLHASPGISPTGEQLRQRIQARTLQPEALLRTSVSPRAP
ncbi:MAG: hypothetical protein AAGJ10_07135 [Bacteroidota bacterium]